MRVGYAAAWLPLYLIHRAHHPLLSGEIPAFVSGLHKSTIDVASTVQLMAFEALCQGHADRLTGTIRGEAISDYAETHGFFIGGQGVCAGPPAMIQAMVSVLVGEDPAPTGRVDLEDVVGDPERCFEFLDGLVAIVLAKHAFTIEARRLSHDIAGALGTQEAWPGPRDRA